MFCTAVFLLLLPKILYVKVSRKISIQLGRASWQAGRQGVTGMSSDTMLQLTAHSQVAQEGDCHCKDTLGREITGPASW